MSGALPPDLRRLLDGEDLAAKVGMTLLLMTTSEDGWPHAAMLSVGELLAETDERLRIALHQGSRTEAGLRSSGRATLLAVVGERAYTLRLACRTLALLVVDGLHLVAYVGAVEDVREHVAPYARLLHGIEFELTDPSALERWARTVAELGALDA